MFEDYISIKFTGNIAAMVQIIHVIQVLIYIFSQTRDIWNWYKLFFFLQGALFTEVMNGFV